MNDLVHALMQARKRNAGRQGYFAPAAGLQNPFEVSEPQVPPVQWNPETLPQSPLKPWGPPVDDLPGLLDCLDDGPSPDEREAKARTAQNIEMLIKRLEDINDPRAEKARFCQSLFPDDAKKFRACVKAEEQPV